MRKNRFIAAAVALFAAVLLTGCVSVGGETGETTSRSDTESAPARPAPAEVYAKADLNAALLQPADLPSGYTKDPQAPAVTEETVCGGDPTGAREGGAEDAVSATYSHPSGRFVAHAVWLMPDGVTLADLATEIAKEPTCTDGGDTYTMTKADYGRYGDEVLGYRMVITGEVTVTSAYVFMRRSNMLGMVMVGGIGGSSPAETKAVLAKAAAKLPA